MRGRFGVTSPTDCDNSIDALRPREIYWTMRRMWTGDHSKDLSKFSTCDDLLLGKCIALGNGGNGGSMGPASWILSLAHQAIDIANAVSAGGGGGDGDGDGGGRISRPSQTPSHHAGITYPVRVQPLTPIK